MDIPDAKSGADASEHRGSVLIRSSPRLDRIGQHRPISLPFDANLGGEQEVHRRMS